jgi:hypothetical protein
MLNVNTSEREIKKNQSEKGCKERDGWKKVDCSKIGPLYINPKNLTFLPTIA